MPRLNSVGELEALRKPLIRKRDSDKPCIIICGGTGCLALGAADIIAGFRCEIQEQGLDTKVDLRITGCPGFCERGPLVVIEPGNILYQRVRGEDVSQIISQTVKKGNIVDKLLYQDPETGRKITQEREVPFYKKQERLLLANNSKIDPNNIADYLALGGYTALSKALSEMSPQEVIEEVKKSGLRGRGGGGFPTGIKWDSCRNAPSSDGTRYVIGNADEGDPGAFMDRGLLEGNPHSILEGMIIGVSFSNQRFP
ncbi:hypothetical protein ES707_06406 [subsurface metagenome]